MAGQLDEEQSLMEAEKQQSAALELPELPDPKASPDQVREYLAALLRHRGVEYEEAQSMTAKWIIAGGEELRQFSRDVYTSMFGAEIGWVLHKDVQAQVKPGEQYAFRVAFPRYYYLYNILLASSMASIGSNIINVRMLPLPYLFTFIVGWLFIVGGVVASIWGIAGLRRLFPTTLMI